MLKFIYKNLSDDNDNDKIKLRYKDMLKKCLKVYSVNDLISEE